MTRWARGVVSVVCIAATVICLAGRKEPGATMPEQPRVVWNDGRAPDSPLEADPWVQALRAWSEGVALSWNTGDFTVSQLTDHATAEDVFRLSRAYAIQGDDPFTFRGPAAQFEPLEVTELADGSGAAVQVCQRYGMPLKTLPRSDGTEDARTVDWEVGNVSVQYLERDDDTGRRFVTGNPVRAASSYGEEVRAAVGEWCEPDSVPVGLFEPEPELPDPPVTRPVHAPLVDG